jgi:hypothetical protein
LKRSIDFCGNFLKISHTVSQPWLYFTTLLGIFRLSKVITFLEGFPLQSAAFLVRFLPFLASELSSGLIPSTFYFKLTSLETKPFPIFFVAKVSSRR